MRSIVHRFLSIGAALFALAFIPVGHAVASPLSGYLAAELKDTYATKVHRFEAALASWVSAEDAPAVVRADMRRDSHGFRLASADDYEGFAPLTCS